MTTLPWPDGADPRLVAECRCDWCRALVDRHLRRRPPQEAPTPDGVKPLTEFAEEQDA